MGASPVSCSETLYLKRSQHRAAFGLISIFVQKSCRNGPCDISFNSRAAGRRKRPATTEAQGKGILRPEQRKFHSAACIRLQGLRCCPALLGKRFRLWGFGVGGGYLQRTTIRNQVKCVAKPIIMCKMKGSFDLLYHPCMSNEAGAWYSAL